MPPIKYQSSTLAANEQGQIKSNNQTATIRTAIPGKATSAPATAFPLKLEQIQNVNTKYGVKGNGMLKFNKATGMWDIVDAGTLSVSRRYDFINSLEWVIHHNMGTTNFRETLVDADGTRFTAKTRIIDANTFKVFLTSAMSGWVDVVFDL